MNSNIIPFKLIIEFPILFIFLFKVDFTILFSHLVEHFSLHLQIMYLVCFTLQDYLDLFMCQCFPPAIKIQTIIILNSITTTCHSPYQTKLLRLMISDYLFSFSIQYVESKKKKSIILSSFDMFETPQQRIGFFIFSIECGF